MATSTSPHSTAAAEPVSPGEPLKIAISGSTGFVGQALVDFFRARGDRITRIVRSYGAIPADQATVVWHPRQGTIERAGLEGHDVVIHLAGESIAGLWTDARKRRILESRQLGTSLLARTLAGLQRRPRVLLSASAMGFYGDQPGMLDEDAPSGTGFLPEVARVWEGATLAAEQAGIRVVHLRFGNVLHPAGGMLEVIAPLFRLGLGAPFGSGDQPWPWIARDDVGPIIAHLIDQPGITGPVNVVAPEPATNAQFTAALAAAVGRRSYLRVPAFAARLAPGGMGRELLLGGAHLVPRKLLDSGYTFRWPELRPALAAMLKG